MVTLPGFICLFSEPHPPPGRRGVAILARKAFLQLHNFRLDLISRVTLPSFQLLAARIGRLLVISAYVYTDLPRGTSAYAAFDALTDQVQQLMAAHPGLDPIVTGDFNHPTTHSELHDGFASIGLASLLPPGTPTRKAAALDNIFHRPTLPMHPSHTREAGSDHLAVVGSIRFLASTGSASAPPPLPPRVAFQRLVLPPRADPGRRERHAALLASLKAEVATIPPCSDLDAFQSRLLAVAAKTLGHVPRRDPFDFSAAWMRDPRVKRTWKRLNKARRRYSKRHSSTHRTALNDARRKYAQTCSLVIAEHSISLVTKLGSGQLSTVYAARRAQARATAASANDPLSADDTAAFWANVLRRNPDEPPIETMPPFANDLTGIIITADMVRLGIKSMANRAAGPDGLDVRLLKACLEEVVEPLASHLTDALRTGLPALFRRGRTTLIPKSTASQSPADYRPITVLPVLTRLLHLVVATQVDLWLTQHNKISVTQAGFRRGRTTLEHAANLLTLAGLQQAMNRELYMVFLDIMKAFDSISHAKLLWVLRSVLDLPPAWVEVIRLLLIALSTTIMDRVVPITRGTPQGSPLSPLLCVCFMEDLSRSLQRRGPCPGEPGIHLLDLLHRDLQPICADHWISQALFLFADDVGTPTASLRSATWSAQGVGEWSTARDVRISPKSHAMVVACGPHDRHLPEPIDVGFNTPIPWVTSTRYLGVPWLPLKTNMGYFSPPLNKRGMRFHLLELSTLLTSSGGVRFTNIKVYTTSVHELVLSRALYPSPVVGIDCTGLDKLVNKAARSHFRLPFSCNTTLLRTELNLLPTQYLVHLRRLRFALVYFRCPLFQILLAPLLRLPMLPHLYVRLLDFGVMPLLRQSFTWAGYTLDDVLAAADPHQGVTADQWRRSTRERVHGKLLSHWPHIGIGGGLHASTEQHIRLVCLPPAGFPRYVRLAGPYCLIALHFKAERLRAGPPGGSHHERCACLWCNGLNCECGIHLLICPAPPDRKPPGYTANLEMCLKRIYLESIQEPATPTAILNITWTRALHNTTLTYLRRLDWPHMSAPTTRATLRFLGESLNSYRSSWDGPAGGKNPIIKLDLPP